MSNKEGFILSDLLIGFVLCSITLTLVVSYFQLKVSSDNLIKNKLEESEERIRQAMDQKSSCQKCVQPTPTPSPTIEETS